MTTGEILKSLTLQPLLNGLASPFFYLCMSGGLAGAFLPAPPRPETIHKFLWFLSAPFLEEFTWRTLLQNELEHVFPGKSFITPANIITNAAFALAHVVVSPGLMPALTFFPGLVFGLLWTKFHSSWLCGILHLWYNLSLYMP